MLVGAFELDEPVPQLRDPHMFVALREWVDVGRVGTLALTTLEGYLRARDLGRLHRPGTFYDFTRYRPLRLADGSGLKVPNADLRYASLPGGHDIVFVHAYEPHWRGEEFVESLLSVAEQLGVRRYCLLGAMYGRTPHTRPLGVSGRATEESVQDYLKTVGVRTSSYGGPTTIMVLASERAPERGMEMMHIMVQLPPYVRVEEDFRGQAALLRALDGLYGFNLDMDSLSQEGDKQYQELNRLVRRNPQMRALIRRLEWDYDSQSVGGSESEEDPELPPDIEGFLRELEGNDSEE